jgi:hypothetical protein
LPRERRSAASQSNRGEKNGDERGVRLRCGQVEVEWGRVRAQAARGEEWGRSGSGGGDGDESVLVKHGERTHGGPARGDRGGTWATGRLVWAGPT